MDVTETLNTAMSTGQSNYTLVVIGLISLAAIGFGLRAMIRVLNG
ncbi:LPXTG cell wall anchor domain-containing protein [Vibrio metschnikovii]|nr:LPXTG cell wall anchor domain-containing protein [Vibrio metschnikovii]EKO3667107.1 LPXTG cell wall anchor domain-containing protein [Vibrio metschnikovii]EKO3698398.1 LPXTG cell wall anchor domain-containing protein [Vibrio metschnikovii]EKO3715616.1 LPXTG cell wall anchor domain-containing protein [Vibrio metschnikovii]EKO3722584.1 LPXTG cell wall anchor domain-containing protein [Vibrio metschnikovii]